MDVRIELTEPFFNDLAALDLSSVERLVSSLQNLIDTRAIRNARKSLKIKGGDPF